MRQLLIEAARRRNARKRGGGAEWNVTFDDPLNEVASTEKDLLALDTALLELARVNPRQALIVETRFFGGLDAAEAAEMIGVSEATILRDWRTAKAWLAREMRRSAADSKSR
jgi:RNA polymerase sigma factor (TIGR02999 family)